MMGTELFLLLIVITASAGESPPIPPESKPGQCPAAPEAGICVHECDNDSDCDGKTVKCCKTGCGHVCMNMTATPPIDQCALVRCKGLPDTCINSTVSSDGCCSVCTDVCTGEKGIKYEINDKVPDSDPCTMCTCQPGGIPVCTSLSCEAPSCENPIVSDGKCCPECPVCKINETTYKVGDNITTSDPCEFCVCGKNGKKVCAIVDCVPQPQCPEARPEPGVCCLAVCPSGPNCFSDDCGTPTKCSVSSVTPKDQCCEFCPGKDCRYKGKWYKHGACVKKRKCRNGKLTKRRKRKC